MTKELSYMTLRNHRKKQEELDEALRIANDLIGNPESLEYKALVIMFLPKSQIGALCKQTGFNKTDVTTIYKNWIFNGIWVNKQLIIENSNSEMEEVIQLILIAGVGAGKLKRLKL
jgi:hypothetical protein